MTLPGVGCTTSLTCPASAGFPEHSDMRLYFDCPPGKEAKSNVSAVQADASAGFDCSVGSCLHSSKADQAASPTQNAFRGLPKHGIYCYTLICRGVPLTSICHSEPGCASKDSRQTQMLLSVPIVLRRRC